MNLWIFNHYAALMYLDGDGRHHGLAKYLISKGVKVKIFCADFLHGVDEAIEIEDGKYTCKTGADGVEYVIIKTTAYKNNGLSRIKNMIDYYFRVRKVANEIAKKEGTPDIILASSVHPLALIAGEKFAKKHNIPCLCEIRDLWPETLVELGYLSKKKLLTRLMYRGEHSIYRKSQGVIFTMPGGKDYIKDRGWQDDVPLDKVYHISNGVDLDKFRFDVENNTMSEELLNTNKFKIVYAGSIRRVNKVDELVLIAEILQNRGNNDIDILVYGGGNQKEELESKCREASLNNIHFMGKIDKKYVPYVLSKADLTIVTIEQTNLGKYGISWNKIYEYMACGRPIITNFNLGKYNPIAEYNFGIAKVYENLELMCDEIEEVSKLDKPSYDKYAQNACKAAHDFDYKILADRLMDIMEIAIEDYKQGK